jgi:glutamyl-tRNA reductase
MAIPAGMCHRFSCAAVVWCRRILAKQQLVCEWFGAVHMQRLWRGHQARQAVQKMRVAARTEAQAATMIQSLLRMAAARRSYLWACLQNRAALAIQATYRGYAPRPSFVAVSPVT